MMDNVQEKKHQYRLQDLIDIEAFGKIFDDFYKATRIPSAIIDLEGNVLIGAGWQKICLDFHRKNPEAEKLCIKSDTHIQEELRAGEPFVIYECPHGLVDSCCPVIIDGHHLANVFTGQMLHVPVNDEIKNRFRAQAEKFGFNEEEYLAALSEVPVFPIKKHKTILEFLAALTGKMAKMGLANLQILEKSRLVRESEDRYSALFDNNHTVILLIDPDTGNIVDANPAACSFYGYNKEELITMVIADINCLSHEHIDEEMARAREEQRNHFIFRHRLADGAIRDVEVYSSPITLQGRTLLYSIVHDITERKKTEEALAKTNEEWHYAMDFLDDAVYLLDLDDKVVKANKTFYDMTGLVPGQVIGHDITSIIHPEGEAVPCPLCVARRDRRDAEVYMEPDHPCNPFGHPMEVMVKMIRNKDEDPIGVLMGIKDLSKQKKVEQVLRRGKEEWEKTFDSISDIITIQDKDMRIVRANKSAHDFFNVEPGWMNGRLCYEVFRQKNSPCAQCPETETLCDLTRHAEKITHENLGKTFHVSSDPVFDEWGNLKYIVHIAKDITEQIKLEEELFQAQKMEAIGTLAGGIAHDFNNLLSAILGYSELAQLEIESGGRPEEDIDQVIVAAKRATDLVKQILTYSRATKQQLQPLRPHLIIRETLKLLRASLPVTIQIEEDIDRDCGLVLADKTQVHQIMMNLCTNSAHAMRDEKGTLTVTLCQKKIHRDELPLGQDVQPGMFIELSVSDTGHGMDEKTVKKIFDPYFTTKEVDKGTGLGLAVTHGIIQEYKGFIRVESKPGEGTTFSIYFPVLKQDRPAHEEDGDDQALPVGNDRILFVDDDKALVIINKSMLERLGYTVTGETDSREALEKVRADPDQFDLIITDMTMPDMTGDELAREVLRLKPTMPIILCTGYSSMITEKEALTIGIKKFVTKPIMKKKLAETVRMVLDEKQI